MDVRTLRGFDGPVDTEGMAFVCVRTYSAGVHCGYLAHRDGREVLLYDSIRVWYWSGACSLSELATRGSAETGKCKYAVTVPVLLLTEAVEIIPMSEEARVQMQSAPRWDYESVRED